MPFFSYTFERVQENSEKLWRFERYTVINDYDWRIPSPINLIFLPYRFCCCPTKEKCCLQKCKSTKPCVEFQIKVITCLLSSDGSSLCLWICRTKRSIFPNLCTKNLWIEKKFCLKKVPFSFLRGDNRYKVSSWVFYVFIDGKWNVENDRSFWRFVKGTFTNEYLSYHLIHILPGQFQYNANAYNDQQIYTDMS